MQNGKWLTKTKRERNSINYFKCSWSFLKGSIEPKQMRNFGLKNIVLIFFDGYLSIAHFNLLYWSPLYIFLQNFTIHMLSTCSNTMCFEINYKSFFLLVCYVEINGIVKIQNIITLGGGGDHHIDIKRFVVNSRKKKPCWWISIIWLLEFTWLSIKKINFLVKGFIIKNLIMSSFWDSFIKTSFYLIHNTTFHSLN